MSHPNNDKVQNVECRCGMMFVDFDRTIVYYPKVLTGHLVFIIFPQSY